MDKTTIASALRLRRSEILRSLRHYLRAQSQRHNTIGRLEEKGVERRTMGERAIVKDNRQLLSRTIVNHRQEPSSIIKDHLQSSSRAIVNHHQGPSSIIVIIKGHRQSLSRTIVNHRQGPSSVIVKGHRQSSSRTIVNHCQGPSSVIIKDHRQSSPRTIVSQTDTGTVSKETLGEILRDEEERILAFPRAQISS